MFILETKDEGSHYRLKKKWPSELKGSAEIPVVSLRDLAVGACSVVTDSL